VFHFVDERPIGDGRVDDFALYPQAGPGDHVVGAEVVQIEVLRFETSHAERQERHGQDDYNERYAYFEYFHVSASCLAKIGRSDAIPPTSGLRKIRFNVRFWSLKARLMKRAVPATARGIAAASLRQRVWRFQKAKGSPAERGISLIELSILDQETPSYFLAQKSF
jgi:hypothetical protein